jgi:hypothetical protein
MSAGATARTERSLGNATDWSLLRQKERFRLNPGIEGGDLRAFDAALTLDTRPRDASRAEGEIYPRASWSGMEHWHRIGWERGDGGLGGDLDFWKLTADLRTYFRLTADQALAVRVLAGSGESRRGALPAQRRYAIGGLGTLRGHNYRDLRGDRVALANVEYGFTVGDDFHALAFVDAGTAWDDGALKDQRIPVDVGLGFRFDRDDDGLTILAARPVNEENAGVKVSVRFEDSF